MWEIKYRNKRTGQIKTEIINIQTDEKYKIIRCWLTTHKIQEDWRWSWDYKSIELNRRCNFEIVGIHNLDKREIRRRIDANQAIFKVGIDMKVLYIMIEAHKGVALTEEEKSSMLQEALDNFDYEEEVKWRRQLKQLNKG